MMEVKIESGQLVIKIPLGQPQPSATGKTLVVASSRGNQQTTATIKHEGVDKPVSCRLSATQLFCVESWRHANYNGWPSSRPLPRERSIVLPEQDAGSGMFAVAGDEKYLLAV